MRELQHPELIRGGFEDSRDIRAALDVLTDISRMRSAAHAQANLFRDFHIEVGGPKERQLRGELQEARGVLARWAVMTAYEEFRTVDLARVENDGDWEATLEAESGIGELGLALFMDGQVDGFIERDTPEAKLRIMVDPDLLSSNGLVAVRRKRLMLATPAVTHHFTDRRPTYGSASSPTKRPPLAADVSLEIDKVSEFVLDVQRLRTLDPTAAEEVYEATNGGEIAGEITNQPNVTVAPRVIETAINKRDKALFPANTIYYADRKYRNIRRIEEQAAELMET